MSDPKRANLITVVAPKSAKKIVNKTVRLTINLAESNESKYPELNYKELVIAEERKHHVENGKSGGLDPFSDNDEDVERVARKFEQKYGNNSTYGKKKRRSKDDDFADIGAGYDENDSFIDNTDGYDEMIPPDIDTYLGGFYINCGSLEFKTVPQDQTSEEPRRNKRRISSSSSEEESSDSSSDSESQDTKDPKAIANGDLDSHKTEHRKKKNKKDKPKAKKVRRADSSAANSGKQTSDDNIHPDGEGESVDSRTSHSSHSLTSKPAPSSENAVTSDSSRDAEMKVDVVLPEAVTTALEALENDVAKYLLEHPTAPASVLLQRSDTHLQRLESALSKSGASDSTSGAARNRAARALGVSRAKLVQRARALRPDAPKPRPTTAPEPAQTTNTANPTVTATATTSKKRKLVEEDKIDISKLSDDEREDMIMDTIRRLMDLIEEFKPSMFANYNMECERVREEKKKLSSDGATVDKRLPKRRFPWCHRSKTLLYRLTALAGTPTAAAALLADRVLPLFPKGFVRMPTLMRQANISKDVKIPEIKRQRHGSASSVPITLHSHPSIPPIPAATQVPGSRKVQSPPPFFSSSSLEQIQFPSSLTVTATVKSEKDKNLPQIMNTFSLNKDVKVEKNDKQDDAYIPPNNIGSITITPVTGSKDKKPDQTQKTDRPSSTQKPTTATDKQPSLIRVKSPAALNDAFNKKEVKTKKPEKSEKVHNPKDKRLDTPLQIDTNFQPTKKDPSPKSKDPSPKSKDPSPKSKDPSPKLKDPSLKSKEPSPKSAEISPKVKETATQKQIESLRVKENNIPRPALVPVHHSPTFAKPEKRTEAKKAKDPEKKKGILIVSDLDPLSDQEPVAVDDSSSDVEVIENDKSEVPLIFHDNKVPKNDEPDECISRVMKDLREMEHSQDTKLSSNSFSGIVSNSNAKHGMQSNRNGLGRSSDTLAERTSLNKTDGCNGNTG